MTATSPQQPRPPQQPAADSRAIPHEPVELWTVSDLVDFLPWRRSSVYRLVRAPGFPPALALPGPGRPRRVWLAAEVRAWALAAPRTPPPAQSRRPAEILRTDAKGTMTRRSR